MKFVHISDLHLGKRVNGFSMLEDQAHIMNEILGIIRNEQPDAVLISGDVYDKLSPPAEAVTMLDSFLSELASDGTETFIISGNHDSAERIAFGSSIMNRSGIHFSPVYNGKASKFTLNDEYGEADIFLLPYLRAAEVKRFFPECDISTAEDALRTAVSALGADPLRRNIIVSHQFVAGGITCDSERNSIGGTDSVPADVYKDFDYAALGHLHGAQFVGSERVRYSGTPLKYSFSEVNHRKSVTAVTLRQKGEAPEIKQIRLKPLRDMRVLRGSFGELIEGSSEDYLRILLTDTSRVSEALNRLRANYPRIMALEYENELERDELVIASVSRSAENDPLELFAEFYTSANGKPLTEQQTDYMRGIVNEIWG